MNPLDPQAWLTGLDETVFLREAHLLEVVDSTNQCLMEWVRSGRAGPGVLLAAESQTRGRGRMGREWHALPGAGLTFSFTLRNLFPRHPGRITVGTALAAAEAIRRETGIEPWIKWPNDLYLDGGKAGGVLAEVARGPSEELLVVGIGLNVNGVPEVPSSRHGLPPVCLRQRAGRTVDRNRLLRSIVEAVDRMVRRFEAGDHRYLAPALRARSILLGRRARFEWNREVYEGRVLDHTEALGILLETSRGTMEIPGAFATLVSSDGLPSASPP